MLYRLLLKMWWLPPLLNIWLVVLGLVLAAKRPRLGRLLIGAGVLSLYLLSVPAVTNLLLQSIAQYPPLDKESLVSLRDSLDSEQTAVVVLGAGHYGHAEQYGGPMLNESAVLRVNYAAWLAEQLSLRWMVTGGAAGEASQSHAEISTDYARRHLGRLPDWQETQSRTTAENASFAAKILAAEGIQQVVLVTHSYHIPRGVMLFERAGLEVIAAPIAGTVANYKNWLRYWIPDARSLLESRAVLHEYLGLAWYRLSR